MTHYCQIIKRIFCTVLTRPYPIRQWLSCTQAILRIRIHPLLVFIIQVCSLKRFLHQRLIVEVAVVTISCIVKRLKTLAIHLIKSKGSPLPSHHKVRLVQHLIVDWTTRVVHCLDYFRQMRSIILHELVVTFWCVAESVVVVLEICTIEAQLAGSVQLAFEYRGVP